MRLLAAIVLLGLMMPLPALAQEDAAAPDVAPMPAPAAPARKMEDTPTVVLRTVDKLSARTHTFDIPVDKTVKFGNSLFIKVRACRRASPLDKPESAAFLQVWERKPSEDISSWIFSGWMFASNPSLSAMDHPVYDVWVIECKNASTSAKSQETFSSETAPAHAPDSAASVAKLPVAGETPIVEAAPAAAKPEDKKPAPAAPAAADAPRPAGVPALDALPGSFEGGEEAPVTDD
ncbi:MAG: DUF2155 domain-containing protein [Alphaproteobacteria bacterium]